MQVQAFIGIDLCQDTMTVVWWKPFQVHDTAEFPRTEAGCAASSQWCARQGKAYGWVREAAGSLWFLVAHYAEAHGISVYVLNPQRVHALGGVRGRVAKTDALDAEQIAACAQGLRQRGKLYRWEPSAEGLDALRPLARLRAQYQGAVDGAVGAATGVAGAGRGGGAGDCGAGAGVGRVRGGAGGRVGAHAF